MRITERDDEVMRDLCNKWVMTLTTLWKTHFSSCKVRSTPEERANKLCAKGFLDKATEPMLHYFLSPKGADYVRTKGHVPPPKQYLEGGQFRNGLSRHIPFSVFAARTNATLIRQTEANERFSWLALPDKSRTYFCEGDTVYALSVNTRLSPRQIVKSCFQDGEARIDLHGEEFDRQLERGAFKWCILVASRGARARLLEAAKQMQFPAEGVPPAHSLRCEVVTEIRAFIPKRKSAV